MYGKKYVFTLLTLAGCLAILLSAVVTYSSNAHAATHAPQSHKSSKSNITVSPNSFTEGDAKCTLSTIGDIDYEACPVIVSAPQSGTPGVAWTSSYTAQDCYVKCVPDYRLAVLPSQARAYASQNAKTYLLFPEDCYHNLSKATITFAGPANKVNATFTCVNPG